jgi:ATP-dependent RNA helicase DeaD
LGQARTGTGKTAAFAIPIIERIKHGGRGTPPSALILVPTRELAVQVRDEFDKLAHGSRLCGVPIYGGKPIRGQIAKLEKGADVIIGTPGRVIDLIGRGALDLRAIKIVVLDEADRMLDIGFRPDIEKILRRCPKERQTLLLSATVAPPVERLARTYMHNPEVMDFSPTTKAVDTIEQFYFTVDHEQKFDLLVRLIKRDKPEQAIVFCRTKRGTERIHRRLSKHFPATDMMHGDMQQGARDRVMKAFRAGEVQILVATDVVGRGIDVSSISHIINFDIPQSSDDYVHRVGRTGRMGREGVAYTFVTTEEGGELTRIEILINRLLKRDEIDGFIAVASVAPAARGMGARDSAPDGTKKADAEPETPPPPKPTPPGRRPPKRHRRAL